MQKPFTKEHQKELEEAMRFKMPSNAQLVCLANKCGFQVAINHHYEVVLIESPSTPRWNPVYDLAQNHALLSALIAIGDCKLFYDDGAGDYFIYKFNAVAYDTNLANFPKLNETVIAAAVALWCPED